MSNPSYPLHAYNGNDLLDLFMNSFYQSNPDYFSGSQVLNSLGLEYTYEVVNAPTAQLGPFAGDTTTPSNISLILSAVKMDFYEYKNNTRGMLILNTTNKITVYGEIAVNTAEKKMSLRSLKSKVEGGSFTGIIQTALNTALLPALEKKFLDMDLPQMQDVFGTDLHAGIADVTVTQVAGKAVYQLNTYATIDSGNTSSENYQISPEESSQVITETQAGKDVQSADLTATANAYAINTALKALFKGKTENYKKTESKIGFDFGIDGSISIDTPVVSIKGGQATATANVSCALKFGIKSEIYGGWHWVSIPIPATIAEVEFALEKDSSGKKALIQLLGLKSFKVDISDWPTVLKPVGDLLNDLLAVIITLFRQDIAAIFKKIKIDLFALPDTIPGTGIKANLSFTSLGFVGSVVQAVINIAKTT